MAESQTHHSPKPNPWLITVIVIFVLLVIGVLYISSHPYASQDVTKNPTESNVPTQSEITPATSPAMTITPDEKLRVDAWIEKKQLNSYGDPKETAYAGGTPLFNESTGTTMDRYEYILKHHPDRPWNN